jgi:hypothetical protein
MSANTIRPTHAGSPPPTPRADRGTTVAQPQAPAPAKTNATSPATPRSTDGFDAAPAGGAPQLTGATPSAPPDPQLLGAQTTYNRIAAQPGGPAAMEAMGVESPEDMLALTQALNQQPPDAAAVDRLKAGLAAAPPSTQKTMMNGLSLQSPGLARLTRSDADLTAAASGEGIPQTEDPNAAHPTATEVAAMPQEDKDALAALGLTPEDVVGQGPAVAELILAGKAALAGEGEQAITHLQNAAAQAKPLAEKVITSLASKLPEPTRSVLSDSQVVGELLSGAPGALKKMLFDQDVLGGLADLAALPATRDKILDIAAQHEPVKGALAALGLDADDLKAAGAALPELLQAVKSASEQDWGSAVKHLQAAAPNLTGPAKEALTHSLVKAAGHLDDANPAKRYLTDPAIVGQLLDNGPEVLQQLLDGKVFDALATLADDDGLRDAILEQARNDPKVTAALEKAGLTIDDLKAAGAGLPDLFRAIAAVDANDWTSALQHLQAAVQNGGGDLAAKVVSHAAESLPEGSPARALLSDPAVVKELLESGVELAGALLEGDGSLGTLLESIKSLPNNGELLNALANNTWVKEQLGALGLTPEQLGDAVNLLPDLLTAGQEALAGNWDKALDALQKVGANLTPALKDLIAKGVNTAAQNLPEDNPLKPYLTDPAVARALLDSAPGVMQGLATGDPWAAVQAVAGNEALRNAVIDVAAKNPAFTERLAQLGLTADDLKAAGAALPQLAEGIRLWEAGEYEAAMAQFGQAAVTAAPAMAKVVSKLAEKLPDGPLKSLLQDTTLMTELIKSGPGIVAKLQRGDIPGAMQDIDGNPALKEALKQSPVVNGLLAEMGIPEELRGEALEIAPTLVIAANAAANGDWDTVVSQLQYAAGKAPGIVGHLGKMLAAKIPGEGPVQDAVRSLLSDGTLLQTLATDGALHQNLKDLLSGDPARMMSGLLGIASNPAVQGAAANALWAAMGPKLQELGIQSADELKGLLGAVPDLLTALDQAQNGHWPEALNALGAALGKVPPGALANVLNSIAQKLDLPPGMEKLRGLFASLGDILQTDGGAQAVGELVDAFRTGDVNKLGSALKSLGAAITQLDQTQQENLLNALGDFLPGKLGELFKDKELNQALAHSGSLDHLFNAGEKLLQGDFEGALTELGEAAIALLGGLPPSVDSLKNGLENFGRLFMRFFETLPNAIRNRIEMAVMAATSNLFGNIPLIGDAIDAGKDLMELIDEMQQGDNLGVVLAGAQLAVDGAKWTQVGKVFTGPLEMALSIAQSADDALDAYNEIKDQFGQIMMTGEDPTPRIEMDDKERKLLQEVMIYGSDLGMTPEQAAAFVEANGDLKNDSAGVETIFKAAKALGLTADQIPGFVNALRAELGGEFDNYVEQLAYMPEAVGNSSFLAHIMELPAVQQFFTEQGIDPVRKLVEAVYQENLGRPPTEQELADGMARIQNNYKPDEYEHSYLDLADSIQNDIEMTQEWRDKHPNGKTVM